MIGLSAFGCYDIGIPKGGEMVVAFHASMVWKRNFTQSFTIYATRDLVINARTGDHGPFLIDQARKKLSGMDINDEVTGVSVFNVSEKQQLITHAHS
jgi:hypothetical protein